MQSGVGHSQRLQPVSDCRSPMLSVRRAQRPDAEECKSSPSACHLIRAGAPPRFHTFEWYQAPRHTHHWERPGNTAPGFSQCVGGIHSCPNADCIRMQFRPGRPALCTFTRPYQRNVLHEIKARAYAKWICTIYTSMCV